MAFMKPTACWFTPWEAIEYCYDGQEATELRALETMEEREAHAGWYGYLSAAGYMDRTEYSGPFKTEAEALQAVMDLYEVDENGDSPEENEPGMVVDGVDEYGSVD